MNCHIVTGPNYIVFSLFSLTTVLLTNNNNNIVTCKCYFTVSENGSNQGGNIHRTHKNMSIKINLILSISVCPVAKVGLHVSLSIGLFKGGTSYTNRFPCI